MADATSPFQDNRDPSGLPQGIHHPAVMGMEKQASAATPVSTPSTVGLSTPSPFSLPVGGEEGIFSHNPPAAWTAKHPNPSTAALPPSTERCEQKLLVLLAEQQELANRKLERENVKLHQQLVTLARRQPQPHTLTPKTKAARKALEEKRLSEAKHKHQLLHTQNAKLQARLGIVVGRDEKRLSAETERRRQELQRKRREEAKNRNRQLAHEYKAYQARLVKAQSPTYYHEKLGIPLGTTSSPRQLPHQPEESLEERRRKFYEQRAREKEEHQLEMERHAQQLKTSIRNVKHGRDAKCLTAETEAQRQALMEQRAKDKHDQQVQLKAHRQSMKQQVTNTTKGRDAKSLTPKVEAQRKSLSEQRRLDKIRREQEIQKQNKAYQKRLQAAISPIKHRIIHPEQQLKNQGRSSGSGFSATVATNNASQDDVTMTPKVLFSDLTPNAFPRNCVNRCLDQPNSKSAQQKHNKVEHYLPPASTTSNNDKIVASPEVTTATGQSQGNGHNVALKEKRLRDAERRNQQLREYNESLVQRLAAMTVTTAQ